MKNTPRVTDTLLNPAIQARAVQPKSRKTAPLALNPAHSHARQSRLHQSVAALLRSGPRAKARKRTQPRKRKEQRSGRLIAREANPTATYPAISRLSYACARGADLAVIDEVSEDGFSGRRGVSFVRSVECLLARLHAAAADDLVSLGR